MMHQLPQVPKLPSPLPPPPTKPLKKGGGYSNVKILESEKGVGSGGEQEETESKSIRHELVTSLGDRK